MRNKNHLLGLLAMPLLLLTSVFLVRCTLSDEQLDENTMDNLRSAVRIELYGEAVRLRNELRTDSFKQIVEQEFPDLDLLSLKEKTPPFKMVETIVYAPNQAGIRGMIHTVLVDSLYLEEVDSKVLPLLAKKLEENDGHQVYLHTTTPPELEALSAKASRNEVIQVAKKGAFGYVVKTKGTDAILMGIDDRGNYIDW